MSFALVALRLVIAPCVSGQSSSPPTGPDTPPADQLQRAAAAFNASNWKDANAQYAAIAKKYPKNAPAQFRMGVTLTELGRPAEALPYLRTGEKLGIPAGNASFRLAEAFAELKMPDSAIAELKRGASVGYFLPASALTGDAHFASLKSHGEWAVVLDQYDAIVQPCRHDARFREFDFWVGDWDVRPNGAPAGGPSSRNVVTLEENGCVVMEHWTGVGGSTGQSFNIFDRSMGKWRQTWVDNGGGQHDYAGLLTGGNMVLEGTTPAANGQLGRVPTKLTFFHVSADTVRQFSETSADGGKTWTVAYDLIYVRRH
jgi:hypothetical protein